MTIDVLLVEDNRADVVMLAEAIRETGLDYSLHVARDSQEALSFLDRQGAGALPRPGMIILDLNLPGIHGADLLGSIRSQPELREVPVVILTTSAWKDTAALLAAFDPEAFFEKPSLLTDWTTMVQTIETYRRRH